MTYFLYSLIAFNALLCSLLFLSKSKSGSPFQFFYLSLLAIVIFPGIFDVGQGYLKTHPYAPVIQLSNAMMISVHSKIAVMLLLFALFEKVLDVYVGRHYIDLPSGRVGGAVYNTVIVAILLVIAISISVFGFSRIANSGMTEVREGPIGMASLAMQYLQIVIIGMPAFYFLRFGKKVTAAFSFLLFLSVYLLFGGSRQVIVFSIAIFLFVIMYDRGISKYIILLLLFTVGFSTVDWMMQLFKLMRNLPSMADRITFVADFVSGQIPASVLSSDLIGSEANVRYAMYGFMYGDYPADFGQLSYFKRALLFWLPSSLDFANVKPEDFEYIMFAEAMGGRSGTMHATFFGSAYADAKEFSFIWIAWFVAIFKILDVSMNKMPPLERSFVWSSCVYFSFMVARGSLYAPLVVMTLVLLIAYISMMIGKSDIANKVGYGRRRA